MKICTTILLTAAVGFGILMVSGCETEAQTKAAWGTAIGAGAGQLIGGDTKATMIGAGVGAGAGYIWGSMDDKKKEQQVQTQAQTVQNDANTVTVWITNSNGSKTPVKLTKTASGGYVGPRGEMYDTMPTEEQLKKVYGF
ncbi:MAG: hypothetical protein ISS71_03420 [Phycisphaerae bacterium]|nr:hypothetical protein [Phycisphaerae bacterium]